MSASAVRATHLIPRICSELDLPAEITMAAKHVAEKASELDLVGGLKPSSVAAAAICLVLPIVRNRKQNSTGHKRSSEGAGGSTKKRKLAGGGREDSKGGSGDGGPKVGAEEICSALKVGVKSMHRALKLIFEHRNHLLPSQYVEKCQAKEGPARALEKATPPAVAV